MSLLALLLAWCGVAFGAPAQAGPFERGVEAYLRADYAAAGELWREALRAGEGDRAATLYNLGNVAFRDKRPLEAAAWYTAALRVAPRDADAWHNLEFVRAKRAWSPRTAATCAPPSSGS